MRLAHLADPHLGVRQYHRQTPSGINQREADVARAFRLAVDGVIGARLYEKHPPRYEYFLTEKGKALGPVLKALYGWGERYG